MLELAEAQQRIISAVQPLASEQICLDDACGRILAETLTSKMDLPPFDNSAMDGYAVQSRDLNAASSSSPVLLRVIGNIPAGKSFSGKIQTGECVRIFTGSPLPPGADAVAMQEDTKAGDYSDRVLFFDSVKPWENIRFHGEDVRIGSTLVESGVRLNAGHLSLLGAAGMETARVARQPVVGFLATGSELRPPHVPLNAGEIYESNRTALAALARRAGAIPKLFPLVPDTLADTKAALEKVFEECDSVVTTGGVSVGEFDFVKTAFEQIGGTLDFWKVSIKPGKPFVFGSVGEKYFFGLPGNPVSAFVTFILLVSPALLRMQGASDCSWPAQSAIAAERFENRGDRRHFVRIVVDGNGQAISAGIQSSHIVSALARANGLLEIPPQSVLESGSIVPVLRFD